MQPIKKLECVPYRAMRYEWYLTSFFQRKHSVHQHCFFSFVVVAVLGLFYILTVKRYAFTAVLSHTRPPTILFRKLRFGGRQSNVSMAITAMRSFQNHYFNVNCQSIRVALSS